MSLSFHGAVQSVTVSRHMMIETPGFRLLLDCGLFQGPRREEAPHWNCELGFDQKLIGTLLLSHAHIPHVGSSYDV
jgi:metallo-beta-lactamase family protein